LLLLLLLLLLGWLEAAAFPASRSPDTFGFLETRLIQAATD